MKRLDAIYLQNGPEDFYYRRRRDNARFVLMGCPESCGTGFCVSMGTSRAEDYDLYLKITQDSVLADCPNGELEAILLAQGNAEQLHVVPDSPASNPEKVTLPANLSVSSFSSPLWRNTETAASAAAAAILSVPPAPVLPCRTFTIRTTEKWANAAESGLPAR